MAWTSMHFAAGMIGGGALASGLCLLRGRGWRWIPLAMTLGGFYALVPDSPRLFREDFPSLPLAPVLGDHDLERRLHAMGDLFFFHARLDAQPREFALHGLAIIIGLYNLATIALLLAGFGGRLRSAPTTVTEQPSPPDAASTARSADPPERIDGHSPLHADPTEAHPPNTKAA